MATTSTLQSLSRTTQETSAQRIEELKKNIAYHGGIAHGGAKALAMLIATMEVRITELEDEVAALKQRRKSIGGAL